MVEGMFALQYLMITEKSQQTQTGVIEQWIVLQFLTPQRKHRDEHAGAYIVAAAD